MLVALGLLCYACAVEVRNDKKDEGLFCKAGTYTGTLNGADYKVIIPQNWNKVLVVYVHGYSYTIPQAQAFFSNPFWEPTETTAEDALLAQGYALAGSSFSAGGWAVKEGSEDTDALVRNIESICGLGCVPRRTILFGVSLGSLTVLKKAEERQSWFWPLYDGVVSGCSIGAGASRTVDLSLQFNLAFDAAFFNGTVGGWPASWGTPQFMDHDINFYYEVLPHITALLTDPINFGRFEFQRLVSFLSEEDYYPFSTPPSDVSLFTDLFFSTQALAELERRAGGKVTGNIGAEYWLPDAAKAYLAQLGVDADALLTYMNAKTEYAPDPKGAAYVKKYADFTGKIRVPVLTMHTRNDGLIPASSDTVYKQTVSAAGRDSRLYQVYTNASGHCNFTPDQLVRVIVAMDNWLKGKKPTPADFPTEAGYQPSDYNPGPWPYN